MTNSFATPYVKLLTIAVVIGVGALLLTRTFAVRGYAQTPLSLVAFTVTQETTSYKKDPKGLVIESRTVARRHDGSTSMVVTNPQRANQLALRRIDLADGRIAMLVDSLRLKASGYTTLRAIASKKKALTNPPENCTASYETLTGRDRLANLDVLVVTRHREDGTRFTEWRSPELQCFALQARYESPEQLGRWRTTSETKFTQIALGEPNETLFEASMQYAETRPSEIMKTLYAKVGLDASSCPTCLSAEKFVALDEAYFKRQNLEY